MSWVLISQSCCGFCFRLIEPIQLLSVEKLRTRAGHLLQLNEWGIFLLIMWITLSHSRLMKLDQIAEKFIIGPSGISNGIHLPFFHVQIYESMGHRRTKYHRYHRRRCSLVAFRMQNSSDGKNLTRHFPGRNPSRVWNYYLFISQIKTRLHPINCRISTMLMLRNIVTWMDGK